jgi:hypothetical protein
VVVGAAGHQDIPSEAVDYIKRAVDIQVSSVAGLVGVCSLAAGGDQLFAEALLKHGGELNVVIPCRGYNTAFSDEADRKRYARLLARAHEVVQLDYPAPSEEAFFAAGKQVVDMADELIAIWDGEHARGHGGTADIVDYATKRRKKIMVIWPEGVER